MNLQTAHDLSRARQEMREAVRKRPAESLALRRPQKAVDPGRGLSEVRSKK